MRYQYNFVDELIVDSFAGGGGASTGIELALGRIVDIAINHDIKAIQMHEQNHPFTKHYCENVFDVEPLEATQGRPVGLFWLSPDCTHFSKAKGGKPVKKEIRGLAWIAVKWAASVRPRVIMLENVEEFKTWGPIKNGRPISEKKGETFNKFVNALRNLGYEVDWRVLKACDYGAPTTRKRFFLIARCDGENIVWPEPTHGPGKLPYRTAAECIDFTIPSKSIFNRKKPLAENTLRRIARGTDEFTIKNKKPFIIPVGYSEAPKQAPRVNDIDKPLGTIVSTIKHNLVEPKLQPYIMTNTTGHAPRSVNKPVSTITTGNNQFIVEPKTSPFITQIGQTGFTENRSKSLNYPLTTICTKNEHCLISPVITQYHSETKNEYTRTYSANEPIKTIDTNPRYALTTANLVNYYSTGHALDVEKPLPTQTTKDRVALVEQHLCVLRNNMDCKSVDEPLPTITTSPGHFALIKTYLHKYTPDTDVKNWPQIRELLNKYCGYNIADDEILILEIDGVQYFIADIEMRMLTPRELYRCQGFPDDYIINFEVDGKWFSKSEQVKKVGNSVCPCMPSTLIRANQPELAFRKIITTMAELKQAISI